MKAFPNNRSEGMDLRDYFAAKAMQIAMKRIEHDYNNEPILKKDGWSWDVNDLEDIADTAYNMADLMMEARERKDD